VEMLINGRPMHGRPIAFDSDQTTPDSKNAFGVYVKPIKLSTTCPDCGSGLVVNVKLPDPPFPKIVHTCEYCRKEVIQEFDPFVNPLETGRVATYELDPLLHNGDKILDDNLTVAERMKTEASWQVYDDAPEQEEPRIDAPEKEEPQEVDLNEILDSEPLVYDEFRGTQGRAIEAVDGISPEDDSDLEDD